MADSTPRVTVVTAVYNCEDFIARTIESIQAQSIDDWEHICVDDASSDGSAAIVERYAAEDPRVKLIRVEQNQGAPHARNVGIKNARGEFVAILDSDDVSPPDRLEICLEAFEADAELGFLGGQHIVIDANDNVFERIERPALGDEQFKASLMEDGRAPMPHSSFMTRRHLAEAIGGYDERLPCVADYDFALRISPECKCARLDRVVLHYRRRSGQLSETRAFASTLYSDMVRARAEAKAAGREFDEDAAFERVRGQVEGRQGLSRKAGLNLRAIALRAVVSGEHDRFRMLIKRSAGYWPFSPHTIFWWLVGFMPDSTQTRCAGLWSRLRTSR